MSRTKLVRFWWIGLFGVLVVGYAIFWAVRFAVARLGALAPLALGVPAALVLAVVLGWAWHRYGDLLIALATRGAEWSWTRLRRTSVVRGAQARYPRAWRFVAARLDPHAATGLALSIAVLVAGGALWAFLEILFEVVNGSSITGVDERVVNLFAKLREPGLDRFMLTFTYIGSGRSVAVLAAGAATAALVLHRRRDAVLILMSLAAASAFYGVVKLVVARPRPPLHDARIVQAGFAFPSGHATMSIALWGTLALLAVLALRRTWARVLAAAAAHLLAFLIGLSRVYLGVHWPSDVLAGWVGGALWVALAYAVTRIWRSRGPIRERDAPRVIRRAAAGLLVLAAVAFLAASRPPLPVPPRAAPPAPAAISPAQVLPTLVAHMPHYTEGLFGHRQEPVNLAFVATQPELEAAFRAAGWTKAAPLSWPVLKQAVAATLSGRSDPSGPVTPSFLARQPEKIAFSLPVGRSFADRHHIRIWPSAYATTDGRAIWLATASYDAGFAIASGTLLPVHRIAPDIDDERDFIVRDLSGRGSVARADTLQLVPPQIGTNAFGTPFFTGGKAAVLWVSRS